jgi:two-component system OmpR family response regulator
VLRRLTVASMPPASQAGMAGSEDRLRFAGWQLDLAARSLLNPRGEEVRLTGGEFDLLRTFTRHAGRVLSRDFLLAQTRRRESGPFDRTIDVQVGRLRRKIEVDIEAPRLIKSVRGAGYILVPSVLHG